MGVARGLLQERPLQFNVEIFVSEVGNPCPTLGQLLTSRILYALLVWEKQHEIARARFCTQSCSKVGQLLVNSSPTPHPMGSCRGLPCSSPLVTPPFCFLSTKWKGPRYRTKGRVRAVEARTSAARNGSQVLQNPVSALPGCERISVNTLLCVILWGCLIKIS